MKNVNSEENQYKFSYQAVGVCLAANIPVILWGNPGQGKTQVVNHFAKQLKRKPATIIAGIREPSDFIGLPALKSESMEYYPPKWAKDLAKEERAGIVFFDEVSTAPPSVQAALLRVCLERVVGELELDNETRIIAAANPPGIAADGWDLAAPLANRFCHIEWRLPAAVVAKGFKGMWPEYELPTIDEKYFQNDVNDELSTIGDFLLRSESAKTKITTAVPDSIEARSKGFPTPRSWEMAAKASAAVTHLNLDEGLRKLLLTGCVGKVAGEQYMTYRNETDLPDPEDIIANPLMDLDLRPDKANRIGHTVLRAYKEDPTSDRWKQVSKFLVRLFDEGKPDVAYSITRHYISMPSNWPVLPELAKRISDFTKN